jgi:uncharacterized protein (DUF2147 family)
VSLSPFRRPIRSLAVAMSVLGFAQMGAAMAAPLDPSGLWLTKNDASIIKIAPCGTNYCGKIAWLKEPKESDGSLKLDRNNKDVTKRSHPMVGVDLLLDLAAAEDRWKGKVYNPEDGKIYDVTFKVNGGKPGSETAELEGCLFRYLCKSESMKRTAEIPKTPVTH